MPKILNDEQIDWQEEDRSRLSYEMIFNQSVSVNERDRKSEEKEEPDVEDLLKQQEKEWEAKLEKAQEEAYSRGRKEGLKAGLEEARSEIGSRLSGLEKALAEGHTEWQERQRILDSGLLDLVFEISERILGIPVENPAIRQKLEKELSALLQKVDAETKPLLLVSSEDYEFVEQVKDGVAPGSSTVIKMDKSLNPGEFSLETNHETVIHKFQVLLDDFKDSLSLPPWKA
jgi:flagellar biosynthesis/type III secretory pathway protein FliH